MKQLNINNFLAVALAVLMPVCAQAQSEQTEAPTVENSLEADENGLVTIDGVPISTEEYIELNEGYGWLKGPLPVTRGSYEPSFEHSIIVDETEKCRIVTEDWGWEQGSCRELDAIVIQATPQIDTLIVERPNSDGFVTLDDWKNQDPTEQIDAIWDELIIGLEAQSANLGISIVADDWFIYPTLNEDEAYAFYATKTLWDDKPTINVKAMRFDRSGYVTIRLVPARDDITADELRSELELVINEYHPSENQRYADFVEGDKVAAVGALGVLAAAAGVKFGKAAAGGLLATALFALKKFWFVLLAPLAFLRRFLPGQKDK